MLSVSDMFYTEKEDPVLVVGTPDDRSRTQVRRGYLSRQDSRNFRSSASPPPSRSNNHASSWFGHRKSSQSPPRGRYNVYQSGYDDYRNTKYGRSPERSGLSKLFHRRSSNSPPSGYRGSQSYREDQAHTMYKEDYTGYPQGSGYTARDGYERGYDRGYGHRDGYVSGHGYSSSVPGYSSTSGYSSRVPGYSSSDHLYGPHVSTIPRTYQSTYGGSTVYDSKYAETVKLKVPLCCEACEERITNHMLALEGVESVTCDQVKQKVTVRGTATPSDILRQGRECFKQTRFW